MINICSAHHSSGSLLCDDGFLHLHSVDDVDVDEHDEPVSSSTALRSRSNSRAVITPDPKQSSAWWGGGGMMMTYCSTTKQMSKQNIHLQDDGDVSDEDCGLVHLRHIWASAWVAERDAYCSCTLNIISTVYTKVAYQGTSSCVRQHGNWGTSLCHLGGGTERDETQHKPLLKGIKASANPWYMK